MAGPPDICDIPESSQITRVTRPSDTYFFRLISNEWASSAQQHLCRIKPSCSSVTGQLDDSDDGNWRINVSTLRTRTAFSSTVCWSLRHIDRVSKERTKSHILGRTHANTHSIRSDDIMNRKQIVQSNVPQGTPFEPFELLCSRKSYLLLHAPVLEHSYISIG